MKRKLGNVAAIKIDLVNDIYKCEDILCLDDNQQLEELDLEFAVKNEILTANDYETIFTEQVNMNYSLKRSKSISTFMESKEQILPPLEDNSSLDEPDEDNSDLQSSDNDESLLSSNSSSEVWWVNQGFEYDLMIKKLKAGKVILRARPKGDKALAHHDRVERMKIGDLVVHYSKLRIRAISRVIEEFKPMKLISRNPEEALIDCRVVQLGDFTEIHPTPSYHDFKTTIQKLHITEGPINKAQTNQGYIYRLSWPGLLAIQGLNSTSCEWPAWAKHQQ